MSRGLFSSVDPQDERLPTRFQRLRSAGPVAATYPLSFSEQDEKQRNSHEFFAKEILSILPNEQTSQTCEDVLAHLLSSSVEVT